ncbi:hypothetical protein GF323_01060 [Candidatus Woesearchaeota archaeon]|nr:hypothetical protein [Candidatus Woesearchaeota archaeon]
MARILFGVQGEGMGHAIRSDILLRYLTKNHEIRIFAGNRAYKFLSKRFRHVEEIESQNIGYKNSRVVFFGTIWLNLKKFPKFRVSYRKLKQTVKDFQPDIIISDFEALTNFLGNFSKAPLIQINNQNDIIFRKNKLKLSQVAAYINTWLVTKVFTFGADKYIMYSLDPMEDTEKKIYTGNLIKDEMKKRKHRYGDHIFVYQTSNTGEKLIDILKQLDENFIVYGFNKNKKEKNIIFRKFNDDIYFEDYCEAKALIANGGLTTITEAIYMKKPILSIPIKGQYEQVFNAKTVEKMGFGMYLKEGSKEKITEFLNKQPKYTKNLQKYKPISNEQIFRKVEKQIRLLS